MCAVWCESSCEGEAVTPATAKHQTSLTLLVIVIPAPRRRPATSVMPAPRRRPATSPARRRPLEPVNAPTIENVEPDENQRNTDANPNDAAHDDTARGGAEAALLQEGGGDDPAHALHHIEVVGPCDLGVTFFRHRLGLEIIEILPGAVGARAGLSVGDVIVSIGERPVRQPRHAEAVCEWAPHGAVLAIAYYDAAAAEARLQREGGNDDFGDVEDEVRNCTECTKLAVLVLVLVLLRLFPLYVETLIAVHLWGLPLKVASLPWTPWGVAEHLLGGEPLVGIEEEMMGVWMTDGDQLRKLSQAAVAATASGEDGGGGGDSGNGGSGCDRGRDDDDDDEGGGEGCEGGGSGEGSDEVIRANARAAAAGERLRVKLRAARERVRQRAAKKRGMLSGSLVPSLASLIQQPAHKSVAWWMAPRQPQHAPLKAVMPPGPPGTGVAAFVRPIQIGSEDEGVPMLLPGGEAAAPAPRIAPRSGSTG